MTSVVSVCALLDASRKMTLAVVRVTYLGMLYTPASSR